MSYFLINQNDDGELRVGKSDNGVTLVDGSWWPIQKGYLSKKNGFYLMSCVNIQHPDTSNNDRFFTYSYIDFPLEKTVSNINYFPLNFEITDIGMTVKDYYCLQITKPSLDKPTQERIFYVQLHRLLSEIGSGGWSTTEILTYKIEGQAFIDFKANKELKIRVKTFNIEGAPRKARIKYYKQNIEDPIIEELGIVKSKEEYFFSWSLSNTDDITGIEFVLFYSPGESSTISLDYIEIYTTIKTQIENFFSEPGYSGSIKGGE